MSTAEVISLLGLAFVAATAIVTAATVVSTTREAVRGLALRLDKVEEELAEDRRIRQEVREFMGRLDERIRYLPCVAPRGECVVDPKQIGGSVRT